jgi:hypothetical protein
MAKIKHSSFVVESVLLLMSFLAEPIAANNPNFKNVDSIFYHIYNQQFDIAEMELSNSKIGLKSSIYFLLETDLLWWRTLSANSETAFAHFEEYLIKNLTYYSTPANVTSLEKFVCLNYLLRMMATTNQHLKMINYFFKVNWYIDSFDNSSLSVEEKDIVSIYNAVFNIGKSKILFINSKNNLTNIAILKSYLNSQSIVNKTLSHYFLAKIYTDIENVPSESKIHYRQLCLLYPNNQIFKKAFELYGDN